MDASRPTPEADPRELLRRTLAFLERCREAPRAALESEDPAELLRAWQTILDEEEQHADADPERPTLPFRPRKSA